MQPLRQLSKTAVRLSPCRRWLQTTAARQAVHNLQMPAMSPTMTEGGITEWKKKEGEAFAAGDVLLEVETDKANIDVEAPDDGVMGKILVPNGAKNIPVGQVIALLAEAGDDISNLQAPPEAKPAPSKQEAPSAPPPPSSVPDKQQSQPSVPPTQSEVHIESSRPLFPSVIRLLEENNIENADKIKGTGVRGMLTKGDVLAFLGQASSPTGTFKEEAKEEAKQGVTAPPTPTPSPPKKEEPKALDGAAVRRLIVNNMLQASLRAQAASVPKTPADFDSIIAEYLPPSKPSKASAEVYTSKETKSSNGDVDDSIYGA